MIRVLLKKQLSEIFRSYFYDQKKNKARSKGAQIGMFVLFAAVMVVMLGGMFTVTALSMCGGLVSAGADWLYFAVMGLLSVFLGVFGGVFSTYASLYLAKDNDLLFAMPIPVKTILLVRLLGVYLMGAMYAAVVIVPALIVYWAVAAPGFAAVLCGLAFALLVTLLVLTLSCALGWVVAKISLKLKNKSFITVIISLAFFGGYYFVYFKATELIRNMVENAAFYSEKIKGAAYGLYLFGLAPAGDPLALLAFAALTVLLFFIAFFVLSKSFLKIATATGAVSKVKYKEKAVRVRRPGAALLGRELRRFAASPNYMLNCGLGALFLPAAGIALLFRGKDVADLLSNALGGRTDVLPAVLAGAACLLASMIDTAAPSVSLEGKSVWLAQSLPVSTLQILRAKLGVQLLLAAPAMAVCVVCGGIALGLSAAEFALTLLFTMGYTLLNALFDLFLGVRLANLTWTNEITPIKQGGSVTVSLFSAWGAPLLLCGPYFLVGGLVGPLVYFGVLLAIVAVGCLLLWRWLKTEGVARFEEL